MLSSISPASIVTSRSAVSSRSMSNEKPATVTANSSSVNRENSTAPSNIGGTTHFIYQDPLSQDSKARSRGRKGHTKSRTGCLNCKKARIKCKENRPSCDFCSHRDLKCEWPALQINQVSQVGAIIRKATPSLIPAAVHTPGPVFNMQDFKLFHHFIQAAYPHHPPLNDSVWTHEIPSFASDYEFLLHSMLALSASDIAETPSSPNRSELKCVAMSHRVKAISSLNEAIGKPIASVEQGNAMIATCFSLLFQPTLLNDGLIEYMTFIRGVVVVSMHMGQRKIGFLFKHMFDQAEIVASELTESPLVNPDYARRACRSLELIGPVAKSPREKEYYGYLLSAARALFTSSADAYSNLAKIYGLFSYSMSHEEFAFFTDPTNEAGKILQSHFAALQIVMTPFTRRETIGRRSASSSATLGQIGGGTTARWLVALHCDIKPEMRSFYEWPIWVEKEMEAGRLMLRWDDEHPEEEAFRMGIPS